MTTNAIEVRNLRIAFGIGDEFVTAVDDISFSAGKAEILAVVGESGSGKTVTARAMLGLVAANARIEGSIKLNGQEILGTDDRTLRSIRGREAAMVFQEPSLALNPVYSIGWQIGEGLRAHGMGDGAERRRKAIELLRAVGIPEPEIRLRHYPHQFSGGQKQRVIIAMALALNPSVIVADEPTTALDVTIQAEILTLLRRCRDQFGSSILMITHNMGIVADLADRAIVMHRGKLVETAFVDDLFENPRHEYTRKLLAAVPRLGSSATQSPLATPATAPEATAPLLKAIKIDVRFGRNFQAVKDVSFDIQPGEVLGLVGESGSGKTTIARTIVGLAPLVGGSLSLLGSSLSSARGRELRALRRKIGFIFQDPASSFNPHLTIAECIAEPIKLHRYLEGDSAIRGRVAQLLEQVHLPATFAARYPHQLSGGQRQRVGIARALALDPSFVIADEPTSALDVSVQARLLETFKQLQKQLNFAALFISHDLAVVEQVANRIGVLRRGELLEIGETKSVLTRPAHDYTRQLIDAVPIPDPRAQRSRRAKPWAEM